MSYETLRLLLAATGHYTGQGINHENERFTGDFKIEPVLGGRAVQIRYRATGEDGTVYHEELTLIAPALDESLQLTTLNTNLPGMITHQFSGRKPELGAKEGFVFNYNDPADSKVFREEICLGLYANGDIGYRYSWGMPGGDFAFRSSVRLTRTKPTVS